MKSKQLANVLIKIVGLYLCLNGIILLVSWVAMPLSQEIGGPKITGYSFLWANAIGGGVRAVIGIVTIAISQKIAELWFKNGDE